MADYRTNLTTEVINEIRSYFKEKVYRTIITRNIKLSEAPSFGKPILLYDHHSIGAKKYEEFACEFLGLKERNQLGINRLQENNEEIKKATDEIINSEEIKVDIQQQ